MLVGAQLQTLTAQASCNVRPHVGRRVLAIQVAFTLSQLRKSFPDHPANQLPALSPLPLFITPQHVHTLNPSCFFYCLPSKKARTLSAFSQPCLHLLGQCSEAQQTSFQRSVELKAKRPGHFVDGVSSKDTNRGRGQQAGVHS